MLLWAAFGEQWNLNQKVNFDGVNKKIYVAPSVSLIDVKVDIYSQWKKWTQLYDNSKFLPAVRTIGGDPTGDGKFAGDMYFLMNGWQIVVDHMVNVEGILYHDDPISPYLIEQGGGLIATVSSLAYAVESAAAGLTPAQELQLDRIMKAVKTAIALSA